MHETWSFLTLSTSVKILEPGSLLVFHLLKTDVRSVSCDLLSS